MSKTKGTALGSTVPDAEIPTTAESTLGSMVPDAEIPATAESTLGSMVPDAEIPATAESTLGSMVPDAEIPATAESTLGSTVPDAEIPAAAESTGVDGEADGNGSMARDGVDAAVTNATNSEEDADFELTDCEYRRDLHLRAIPSNLMLIDSVT
jgi:hypothetical protein